MIKDIILTSVLALVIIVALAYGASSVSKSFENISDVTYLKEHNIRIDKETGCHYIVYTGVTPRLDENGNHICKKELQEK